MALNIAYWKDKHKLFDIWKEFTKIVCNIKMFYDEIFGFSWASVYSQD